jgi:ribose-phosphate pyrophosphokinase
MAVFFALPGNEKLAEELADHTCGRVGDLLVRRFPDGETYVRVETEIAGEATFLVCTLARPDPQFLALAFAAATLRRSDAKTVGLIAPYLAYMRQDSEFLPGEAVSALDFAALLQRHFDSIVTVDPHLHRIQRLSEIYRIPATAVHMASALGGWIARNVERPVVIGPDSESAQWVEEIAREAAAPWLVFQKRRLGDRKVRVEAPDLRRWRNETPVLVDDILSSGVTIRRAIGVLREEGLPPPYCLVVHAVCSRATASRIASSCRAFLTSDSVANDYSHFGVAVPIAEALAFSSG